MVFRRFSVSLFLAGVATAIISATAVKLQSDLKKCLEKSAKMDERIVVPDCPPTNEDCPNQLAQCEKEEEDLELERIQKLGNLSLSLHHKHTDRLFGTFVNFMKVNLVNIKVKTNYCLQN